MAEYTELIGILNEAVSLEYTAVIQYNQHSVLVMGRDRVLFEDFFKDSAKESLQHAKMWAERIVYLGGVPSVEIGNVRQSTDVMEMLEINLELEQRAVEVYTRAHRACKHEPTRYMLENHIQEEDNDVEEIKKFLGKVSVAQGAPGEREVAGRRR